MKKKAKLSSKTVEFESDCLRIQKMLTSLRGVAPSLQECHRIWSVYSDRYAAGWLILPEDDELLEHCLQSVTEKEPLLACTQCAQLNSQIEAMKRGFQTAGETIERLQLNHEYVAELKATVLKLSRRLPKQDPLRDEVDQVLKKELRLALKPTNAHDRCPRCNRVAGYTGSGRLICRECGLQEPTS